MTSTTSASRPTTSPPSWRSTSGIWAVRAVDAADRVEVEGVAAAALVGGRLAPSVEKPLGRSVRRGLIRSLIPRCVISSNDFSLPQWWLPMKLIDPHVYWLLPSFPLSRLRRCPTWTTRRPSQPWLKAQRLFLRPTGASRAPPLRGLHVPGSFSRVEWWRRMSLTMTLKVRTEFYPIKTKRRWKKKQKLTKKKQKEKRTSCYSGAAYW